MTHLSQINLKHLERAFLFNMAWFVSTKFHVSPVQCTHALVGSSTGISYENFPRPTVICYAAQGGGYTVVSRQPPRPHGDDSAQHFRVPPCHK